MGVCQTWRVVLTLFLGLVTLVMVRRADEDNEAFANRDSVGALKELRWGLTPVIDREDL